MTSYTIIPSIERPGMFVFSSKQHTTKPFLNKKNAFTILLDLIYDKMISPEEARDLSQKIYHHEKLRPINITDFSTRPEIISTEKEYVEFVFKVTRVLNILQKCKTFPAFFQFTSEFGESLGWIVYEKPNLNKNGDYFEFNLKTSPYIDSKEYGVGLVINDYTENKIDLLTQEYLIVEIEKSSIPDTAQNILN